MADEKKVKSFKGSDVVLTIEREGGKKQKVTADAFSLFEFNDCKVTGEDYYVNKAKKLGAK
tara:strand:- start:69 stop:251 length:183 start_codon:yes stop_codon:yes gene_type:complete